MDTKDLIAPISALLGAVVGGGITTLKDVLLQRRKDKKALEYLAVMVVFALDKYLSEAAEVVCDDGEDDEEGHTHTTATAPTFKPEDLDVEWTSLPPTLVYRIFDLSPRTADARAAIDVAAEHACPPDYEEFFEERQMQFSELGLVAAQLADELRTLSKLPSRTQNEHWNPVAEMKSKRTRLQERHQARADRRQNDTAF